MIDRQKLDSQLMLDEGLRLKAYRDTRGFLTVGVGRNLDANPLSGPELAIVGHDARKLPITHDQAVFLLHNDEMKSISLLTEHAAWWSLLSDVRARVMVDLVFNMGWRSADGKHGLSTFQHFLADMACRAFDSAADDLKSSAWYNQVGNRGPRLVAMVRTDQDYTA